MLNELVPQIPEWEVELAISGAVTTGAQRLQFQAEKGEEHPFTTTVTISKAAQGVRCLLIARAYTQENANDAGVYFVGQALDVLCLRLNTPLYLNLFRPEFRALPNHVRRILTMQEWYDAFHFGREYSMGRRIYSRAISWFRKGLGSEDPIDRVIAFWSALEAIGSQYYRRSARTEQGIINQVCDCFDQLWGPVERWKVIPNNPNLVNEFHNFRNGFSHGFMRVDIETIRDIVVRLPVYQDLVYAFLCDWELQGDLLERNHPLPEALETRQ